MFNAADLLNQSVSKILFRLTISHFISYVSAVPRESMGNSNPDYSHPVDSQGMSLPKENSEEFLPVTGQP